MSESVRSVERAIDVIQALNRNPVSTLGELHRLTAIPKSSLVRLLRALEIEGLVAQTSSYSAYRLLSPVTSLANNVPHEPDIVSIADPLMIDFTRTEGWPTALGLFEDDAIVVRASTIPHTSLAAIQSSLGMRLNLVDYALGQAFLAHLPPDRQKCAIAEAARVSKSAAAHDGRHLRQMLKQVRERGYALRHQQLFRVSSTVAVPVFRNGEITASLGMTWLAAAMPVQQALNLYLPQLTAISAAISHQLDAGKSQ